MITGIRRCGKSFLLFTIFKRNLLENGVDVDHIIEIALDGIENDLNFNMYSHFMCIYTLLCNVDKYIFRFF